MPPREPSYAILDESQLRTEVEELAGPDRFDQALKLALAARAVSVGQRGLDVVPYRRGGRSKQALAFMIEDGEKFAFRPTVNRSAFVILVFDADGAFVLHVFRPSADPDRHPLLRRHKGRKDVLEITADACAGASIDELVTEVRAAFDERRGWMADQYR